MHYSGQRWLSYSLRTLAKKTTEAAKHKYLGRPSNKLTLGVVGLANVGKSTFFQAITRSTLGNPANYPFATIEPEESQVVVESAKLDHLSQLYQSQKQVPTSLTIFDIAGLTRNASSGAGLGNKFLSDIRQVDGLFQVVRGFRDEEIIHIENNVDPVRDLVIVTDELILKDLEFVESGIENTERKLKKPHSDKAALTLEIQTLQKILDFLYDGKKIVAFEWTDEEIEIINSYNFLTAKPSVVLLNVNEADYVSGANEFAGAVTEWISENCPNDKLVLFSAQHETQLNEAREAGKTAPSAKSCMPAIVDAMREALHLISFYTCGPKEARQWSVREGLFAPEAAGVIHTDLQKTFVSAQVYKYVDLEKETLPLNEAALKSKGKQYRGGKTYVVEDGDVLLIKAAGGHSR